MALRHPTAEELRASLRKGGDVFHIHLDDRHTGRPLDFLVSTPPYELPRSIPESAVDIHILACTDPEEIHPNYTSWRVDLFLEDEANTYEKVEPLDLPLYVGYAAHSPGYQEMLENLTC